MNEMIAAIRADKKIGNGTCSVIDECYEDSELAEELEKENITTAKAAVKHFRWIHNLWAEKERAIRNEIF